MPCQDWISDAEDRARESARCDMLARIACELCQELERHKLPIPLGETADWWKEHKKADKVRRDRERAQQELDNERNAALKKLSKREREILNLPRRLK